MILFKNQPLIKGELLFSVIFFSACNRTVFYNKSFEVKNFKWAEIDTAQFIVENPDTAKKFNLHIGFRIGNSYPFSNLYVYFVSRFPDGKVSQDTLQFLFADSKGRPTGKCGGKICEYDFILKQGLKFPVPGIYSFEIVHAMRTPYGILEDLRTIYLSLIEQNQDSKVKN